MEPPKVFVSYAGEESELAEQTSGRLRAKGIDAFFAGWEIAFGDDLVKRINAGLSEAAFFVLLVSPNFLRKAWPMAEQSAATIRMVEDRARLIPVNLGVQPSDFPPLIRALRRIPGEDGDAQKIADRISAVVFGESSKPPLGPAPAFLDQTLNLFGFANLTDADKSVLRLAFEIGAEEFFRADFEELKHRTGSTGIDAEAMQESLEVLEQSYLLKIERHIGGIHSVVLTTSGAEKCCSELVPDYPNRKRDVLAEIVNTSEPYDGNTDEVVKATGQPRWLVCHVFRDAEQHGDLKMHPVHVGHEFYAIDSVSPRLKRRLQQHNEG